MHPRARENCIRGSYRSDVYAAVQLISLASESKIKRRSDFIFRKVLCLRATLVKGNVSIFIDSKSLKDAAILKRHMRMQLASRTHLRMLFYLQIRARISVLFNLDRVYAIKGQCRS